MLLRNVFAPLKEGQHVEAMVGHLEVDSLVDEAPPLAIDTRRPERLCKTKTTKQTKITKPRCNDDDGHEELTVMCSRHGVSNNFQGSALNGFQRESPDIAWSKLLLLL